MRKFFPKNTRSMLRTAAGAFLIAMMLVAASFSASGQLCPASCGGPIGPFNPLGLSDPAHVEASDLITSAHQDGLAAYGALTNQPF